MYIKLLFKYKNGGSVMKTKRIFSMITMLAVLLSLTTTAFAAYDYEENVSQIIGDGNTVVFIDVPSDYWAKDQIDYFAQQGIVAGYEDGSFKLEAGVTREEFCKLLVSTFKPALETPVTPTFGDVSEDRWSYPYVEVCSDFLTGYANPFGGLPTFHPTEYATREDIAVALVRMMGFTDSDANDKNYAVKKFNDGKSISPSLLPYVSIACERGLISGYPDGSFGPTRGITRAETVVLLNRATKQAITDINAELEMTARVMYSKDGKTATINVIAEKGTTVTVNGEAVKMSSNYYDEYEGNYVYKFETEGSKDFVIKGKRAGKTKTINWTAKYEVAAPVLTINQSDQTVTDKDFKLSGKATDKNYSVTVTVNGAEVSVYYGEWSKSYTLTEGENNFEVIATNEKGKQTKKSITITYTEGAPTLQINQKNKTVTDKDFELSGKATDANYSVMVTVNGTEVDVNFSTGEWSKSYTLTEGENNFEVIATNEKGKQTKEKISVTLTVGEPEIQFINCPGSTKENSVTIKGKIKGVNSGAMLFIDDDEADVNSSGEFSITVDLKEGTNTFKFRAVNDYGKEVTETKTITYSPEE